MIVYRQVAVRRDFEVEAAMPGERLEQMIEERYAGLDVALAAAVQIECDRDLRFVGHAGKAGVSPGRVIVAGPLGLVLRLVLLEPVDLADRFHHLVVGGRFDQVAPRPGHQRPPHRSPGRPRPRG